MTLEALYPGRVFLGVGSGEAVNEVPLGLDWPSPREQHERFEAGLEAITRLWNGETVTMDGGWFELKEAKLWTRARSKPKLYVSAFGPQAAQIAGRYGDGLWTLGDPDSAPEVIDAYREACAQSGKDVGEIILQSGIAWAEDEAEAIAGAKRWKPTQLPEPTPVSTSSASAESRRSTAPPSCRCNSSARPTPWAPSAPTASPCCPRCAPDRSPSPQPPSGTAPICFMMPSSSLEPHRSTSFPSSKRPIWIPLISIFLPVGATPSNSPSWVPVSV